MRLTTIALLSLLIAGCGGDDADDLPPFQSQPQARTAAERAASDTTTADALRGEPGRNGGTGEPGAGARSGNEDGASAGESRAGAPRSGQAGADQAADAPSGDERLYTVQVAAFTERAAAEELEEQLRREGLPVWTSVTEQAGQTFYRLRVGVVPTISDARRLGRILTERYEWPVWVAPLTPADRLPADAVEDTRRVLGSE